jgi:hypothetical protein
MKGHESEMAADSVHIVGDAPSCLIIIGKCNRRQLGNALQSVTV